MARAWLQAARDLGIRFESPFLMVHEGVQYWCSGLLPDFGGPMGTIIAGKETLDAALDVADALGYYTSGLSPYCYETYDRRRFTETLNDWGWFGDKTALPAWFNGEVRRHGGPANGRHPVREPSAR